MADTSRGGLLTRRVLGCAFALVAGGAPGMLLLAPAAGADGASAANPPCLGGELAGGSGLFLAAPSSPSTGTTQTGTVQVCVENTAFPFTGTVTVTGTGGPNGVAGYVIANGNSSNPGPTSGYFGAQGALSPSSPGMSNVQIVGCGASGFYEPGGNPNGPPGPTADPADPYGSDHVILDSGDPTHPSLSGQCAVTNAIG